MKHVALILTVNREPYLTRKSKTRHTFQVLSKEWDVFYLCGDSSLHETRLDGETLWVPCVDSWATLPQKVWYGFQWALEQNYEHLMKLDDDIVIDEGKDDEFLKVARDALRIPYSGKDVWECSVGQKSTYHMPRVPSSHPMANTPITFQVAHKWASGSLYCLNNACLQKLVERKDKYMEGLYEDELAGSLLHPLEAVKLSFPIQYQTFDSELGSSATRICVPKLFSAGFANKLYQLAYAAHVADVENRQLRILPQYTQQSPHSKVDLWQDIFLYYNSLRYTEIAPGLKIDVRKEDPQFLISVDFKTDADVLVLDGYFQDTRVLTPDFFKTLCLVPMQPFDVPEAFLHIRGGDYITTHFNSYEQLGWQYYEMASRCFPIGTLFTVFTNDRVHAERILSQVNFPFVFAEPTKVETADWTKMAQARLGGIAANSSFSMTASCYCREAIHIAPPRIMQRSKKMNETRQFDPSMCIINHEGDPDKPFAISSHPFEAADGFCPHVLHPSRHRKALINVLKYYGTEPVILYDRADTASSMGRMLHRARCNGFAFGDGVFAASAKTLLTVLQDDTLQSELANIERYSQVFKFLTE